MCLCDPGERITCGAHLLQELRGRDRLAASLIAEAEWLCRDAAKLDTEETQP